MSFIWRWVGNGVGLAAAAALIPGVVIDSWEAGLLAALVLGLVNAFLRPLAFLLTWPIRILTLGLFTLVLNAGLLLLVAWVVPGFTVTGFWPALLAGLILSAVSLLMIRTTRRRW